MPAQSKARQKAAGSALSAKRGVVHEGGGQSPARASAAARTDRGNEGGATECCYGAARILLKASINSPRKATRSSGLRKAPISTSRPPPFSVR